MQTPNHIVNVSTVKHLSPFRYPGGKTWLVPAAMKWLEALAPAPKILVEPFAGGGIVGLSAVDRRIVERAVFVERDPSVAAVWRTMLGKDNLWLRNQILSFVLTRENAQRTLEAVPKSRRVLAFQTILRNRVQHGGIMAPGASLMLSGENGKGISSRWYPQTLASRIASIWKMRNRIQFYEGDAFDAIPKYLGDGTASWFVDPPYTAGGKRAGTRLYAHADVDHPRLFSYIAACNGPAMLTYDDAPDVLNLANQHSFSVSRFPMKNTHHAIMHELIITKSAHTDTKSRRDAIAGTFMQFPVTADASQPLLFV